MRRGDRACFRANNRPFMACASWRLTTRLAIGRWPAAASGPVPLCLMRAHAASRLEQMPARTHPTPPAAWHQSPRTMPLRSTATYPPSRRRAACFHDTLLALLPSPATFLQMAVFALCAFLRILRVGRAALVTCVDCTGHAAAPVALVARLCHAGSRHGVSRLRNAQPE